MQKKEAHKIFIAIIKSAIKNEKITPSVKEKLTDEFLRALFKLAEFHDLAHVVCYGLKRNGISVPEEYLKRENFAKYRYGINDYESGRIKEIFNEEQIPHIILKGERIRTLYSEPYLRQSCDIDVLVKREDLKRAGEIIEKQFGAEAGEEQQHDFAYLTDSGVSIELHFCFGDKYGSDRLLELTWNNLEVVDGKYGFKMADGLFNAYLIFHAANHFRNGGCGVKTFIDFYMLSSKCNFSAEIGKEILQEIGLYEFAKNIYSLSNVWFNDAESNETLEEMEEFIFAGGTYGTLAQKAQVDNAKSGGNYYKSRIFLPRSEMKLRYKKLEKYPFLLPYYTLKRWFSLLSKKKRKAIKAEMDYKNSVSSERMQKTEQMLKNIGLLLENS